MSDDLCFAIRLFFSLYLYADIVSLKTWSSSAWLGSVLRYHDSET
jgi:hypothetical protein